MNYKSKTGFSLIETLVCLFLLSLILLCLDAMSVYAICEDRNAWNKNVAINQLDSMIERLRALNVREGLKQQIEIWNAENRLLLPNGKGIVNGNYPEYTLTIYWGEMTGRNLCQKTELDKSTCLQEKIII